MRRRVVGALLAALWLQAAAGGASAHGAAGEGEAPAAGAAAAQLASIQARFAPYRLGAFTALTIGFHIRAADGGLPAPLASIAYRYPRQIGLTRTELGMAACRERALRLHGPKACPADSIMGSGRALAQFQVSPLLSQEPATVALVAAPSPTGYLKLLASATGHYPIAARIVMQALLRPGRLQITVPPIRGIPEGPDVAVARVRLTIGGRLTYHERRHGRRISFHPRGVSLPRRCPHGGFHFGATFTFMDGSSTSASTVVACPRGRRAGGQAGSRRRGR